MRDGCIRNDKSYVKSCPRSSTIFSPSGIIVILPVMFPISISRNDQPRPPSQSNSIVSDIVLSIRGSEKPNQPFILSVSIDMRPRTEPFANRLPDISSLSFWLCIKNSSPAKSISYLCFAVRTTPARCPLFSVASMISKSRFLKSTRELCISIGVLKFCGIRFVIATFALYITTSPVNVAFSKSKISVNGTENIIAPIVP